MLTLYQREDSPESQRVRARLSELGSRYTIVNVSDDGGGGRAELEAVSGYAKTPTLVDRGHVAVGVEAILAHLQDAERAEAPTSQPQPTYGLTRRVGLPLLLARRALTEALAQAGLRVLGANTVTDGSLCLTVRGDDLVCEALGRDPFAATWLTVEVALVAAGETETVACARRPSLVDEHLEAPELLRIVERADAALVKALSALPVAPDATREAC